MKKRVVKKIFKIIGWIIFGLILLILTLIGLLYIPPVQDVVKDWVLNSINDGSDTKIEVEYFRLRFPLDVEVAGVSVMERGDTVVVAKKGTVDVAFLPLLTGTIHANNINLDDVIYKLGTPDPVTYLRADLSSVNILDTDLKLSNSDVNIDRLNLNKGRIDLALKTDTMPPTPPTPTDWRIHANKMLLTNIDFHMTMPGVDALNAEIIDGNVDDATIDLKNSQLVIAAVNIKGLNAEYLVPELTPEEPPTPEDPYDTPPWVIKIARINIDKAKALYAISDVVPEPGLDFNYLKFNDVKAQIDSFYNRSYDVAIPIKRLTATERCGLNLNISGLLDISETELNARNFNIDTDASAFKLSAMYGLDTLRVDDEPLWADAKGYLAKEDLAKISPSLDNILKMLPSHRKIDLNINVDGSMLDLSVNNLDVEMKDYFNLDIKGKLLEIFDEQKMNISLNIDGNIPDINFVKPLFMAKNEVAKTKLPPMTIKGNVDIDGKNIDGKLTVTTPHGKLALDAGWISSDDGYRLKLQSDNFPVQSFLPGSGLGRTSVKIDLAGNGFDFFSNKTNLRGDVKVLGIDYDGKHLSNIDLNAKLSKNQADIKLTSTNEPADLLLTATGTLDKKGYDLTLDGNIKNLDLQAIGITDSVIDIAARFNSRILMNKQMTDINASLGLSSFNVDIGDEIISGSGVFVTFDANDTLTAATLVNRDLSLSFRSSLPLSKLTQRFDKSSILIDSIIQKRHINVEELQKTLPPMAFSFRSGQNNLLYNYLDEDGIFFRHADLTLTNDSLINLDANISTFVSGETKIDNASLNISQKGNSLNYRASMENMPGTMDNFAHVQANGYIADDKLGIFLKQQNIKDETGFNLGAIVAATDSTFSLKFAPFTPTIGYKQWTVNKDNYLEFNTKTYKLKGNLLMKNDISSIHIYSSQRNDAAHSEAINVDISDIKIQDWIALNPFAPPIKGDLSASINVIAEPDDINGQGTVTLSDFTYGGKPVGNFDLDLDLTTRTSGEIYANADLKVNGKKVLLASGNLNDENGETPFNLDLNLSGFPLSIANPFIASAGTLRGTLNGQMDATGSLISPKLNGYLSLDSAAMNVSILGTEFKISDIKIPVDSNVVKFNNFSILGANENPLSINGDIDISSFTDIKLDLAMKARNMMVVNASKKKNSEIYGKAYVDITGTAKGRLDHLDVDASLGLLPGTNVTYVLLDDPMALTGPSTTDMVHFVNFGDSLAVHRDEELANASSMSLTAMLNISPGTVLGVDLSTDGQNRVQIEGNGSLEYTESFLGDTRFTGRYTINKGFVRYTPPLMSEKLFDFVDGSYISFNGNIDNPQFNIKAIDRLRANVTQEGQNSRLIYFDVSLALTGSLDNMNVVFDLSTDDDITVENELQSMSPEQRASQAMNMLLYNVYSGPGTKANSNLSGNPLFSFIESQVNSWMANNVKGVDISFGIDQYDRTVDGYSSSTMSYSYRVSKSLFNDRFKIIVGGNYTTDADADENFSQNLINDISFEYLLNKSGTMYIRLFRHTGYESILEGEITETGVGFVYKQKLRSLRDLFRFQNRSNQLPSQPTEKKAPENISLNKKESDEASE